MAALEFMAGVASLSKQAIVLSVVPMALGYLLYRPGSRVLRLVPVLLFTSYLAANAYVEFARTQVLEGRSIGARLALARTYGSREEGAERSPGIAYGWWARLNYANAQTFAMSEFDEGRPGASFRLAAIAWIPRLIWKDKPIIESGVDFYNRLTGQSGVAFGIGYFGEAYWNGGWLFVVLTAVALGWIFSLITSWILKEMEMRNLWVLPIALLWMRSGMRADGWSHTEIVGPGVFTLLCVALLRYWQTGSPSYRPLPLTPTRRQKRSLEPANKPASEQQPT